MEKLAEQAASEPGHCDKEQPEDTCVSCGRAGTEGWGCKLCNAMYHPNCVGSAEGGTEWECSLCRGGPDLGILRAELDNDMPIDRSQVRSFGEHDIFLKVPRVSERGEHELNCYESLRVCGVQETATAICWGSVVVQGQQILVLEQLDPLTREEFVEEVPAALSCIRAIHQAGIVVVDIKPEHFRRRRQGAKGVVVVDFDLARLNGKLPPRASEQPSSFFREYVITPNGVATATFVGTLRYAPLSGHLGLAPTEVGDLVCLLFSVWHIKAGLPWSGSPDKSVQDWLETVDAIKRRAAERDRKEARAELEKWVSWERKKMEGTLLNGLIGDLKLGLLGKGQATVGGAEYVAAAYRVGSLSMEEARFTILEAEAAAHCGAAGVKRGVEALTGLIYRVANMVVDNPPQTSPAHKHSKEGRVLPGGVRNPLGGADDPSERKLSAGNEVPDSGGSAGGDSGSGISSTSRLGRLGGLSTTEQEKRLQEATGAAEEEVRKALGVALEVPIVQKAGKLVRGDGVRESKLGGSFIVTPQLLAFRPAAKDYEIDGFVEDDRAPASLLEALGATDLLEVTQSRLHPTATFPPALRVQCPGQTETGGTDVFVEVIASDHPRSVARKFGQIEAGVCMTRPHPLLLSLKPALLLVAYAGKEEIGPTVQACLRQEGAADLLPYNRFASLLGLAALVHVKTPLAVALAKKVKRRLENLQNTSTMRSYLEVRLEGASITPPKTVEVIIEGATDDTSIELQQPLTIAALIEGSCEGFDLTRSEIKGFKIPSPARPGKKTWLQNDWQLQRDLDIVEIVLRKDVLHKGGERACLFQKSVFMF